AGVVDDRCDRLEAARRVLRLSEIDAQRRARRAVNREPTPQGARLAERVERYRLLRTDRGAVLDLRAGQRDHAFRREVFFCRAPHRGVVHVSEYIEVADAKRPRLAIRRVAYRGMVKARADDTGGGVGAVALDERAI